MTTRLTIYGGTDWSDGQVLYAADLNDTIEAADGSLGEVKMFALSMSGATTKAALQTRGWAICDGTTPAAQGISSPTIATTPNLEHTFIRMSNDESSGTTGGADTKDLSHTHSISGQSVGVTTGNSEYRLTSLTTGSGGSATQDILPTYYELAFFMKVKI